MCHQCGIINMNINKCRIDGAAKWEPFWRAKPLKNGVPSGGAKPWKDCCPHRTALCKEPRYI